MLAALTVKQSSGFTLADTGILPIAPPHFVFAAVMCNNTFYLQVLVKRSLLRTKQCTWSRY